MKWKDSDFRKLLIWLTCFFEEDNGKPSQKRIIAFVLCIVLCRHLIVNPVGGIEMALTIFSFIAVLLGMTYIPTRNNEKDTTNNPK